MEIYGESMRVTLGLIYTSRDIETKVVTPNSQRNKADINLPTNLVPKICLGYRMCWNKNGS